MITSTLHASIRARTASARTAEVSYLAAGIDTGATPLVLLHRSGSEAHDFDFVMPLLGRHRLVVSIELSGSADDPDHVEAVLASELDADRSIAAIGIGPEADIWGEIARHHRIAIAAFIILPGRATPLFSTVTAPTLIIGAENDRLVTNAQTAALLAGLTDARCAWVPGGHAVLADRPAHIISLIDEFLENPARYAPGSTIPRARP